MIKTIEKGKFICHKNALISFDNFDLRLIQNCRELFCLETHNVRGYDILVDFISVLLL